MKVVADSLVETSTLAALLCSSLNLLAVILLLCDVVSTRTRSSGFMLLLGRADCGRCSVGRRRA